MNTITSLNVHLTRHFGDDGSLFTISGKAEVLQDSQKNQYVRANLVLGDMDLTLFVNHNSELQNLANSLEQIAKVLRSAMTMGVTSGSL